MTLASIHQSNPELFATRYDRSECSLGVVHVGYGAFHRAHQAVYIDDYMDQTGDLRWGITAINLRAGESSAFANSSQVENGYILKTTSPEGQKELRLVRSHCQFLDWSLDAESAENAIANSNVHMITITVTESGYYLNDDFSLNINDPLISEEISGNRVSSIYAFLLNGLKRRYSETGNPVNILCCDNIRSNGHMLENNFKHYLALKSETELLEWVKQNVSFPCSMVDRITPRADESLQQEIAASFGVGHYDPIHGEAFSQWVVERNFSAPMPDLAKVGVEIVDDVDPYEEAKIRILNGGHTGLCYLGALAGHDTYDQAFADPELRMFFDNYETKEVLPGLDMELPLDKTEYLAMIAKRFSNGAIADQLERICMDGFSKMPVFIRPTLESCLKQGITPVHGFDCVASWYVFARRIAQGSMPIPYHEAYWNLLEPLVKPGNELEFAHSKRLWADLPNQYPEFVAGLTNAITEMEKKWRV